MNPLPLLPLLFLAACATAPQPALNTTRTLTPEAILNGLDASGFKLDLTSPSTIEYSSLTEYAQSLLGSPYRYGGSSPSTGFDCSGFVGHVYQHSLGLTLPHSTQELAQQGDTISRDALQAGDLVFFNTRRRPYSHVGIYLGDDTFIHAPRSGSTVRIDGLVNRYWKKAYDGARRFNP
jgi:cell wall-associated NlpC family hydrolase